MTLIVMQAVIARLAVEAAAAAPDECCGLLLGDDAITAVLPTMNVASDRRRRFEIDPTVLLAAHKAARAGGPAVIGYYHSHPTGACQPSPADRARAAGDGRVWAIVAEGGIGFWRDEPAGFEPLSYQVADG